MTMGSAVGLRPAVLLAYALPAFVVALPTIPVYIHLPALYGVELGLGLAATGLVLLAARIFDTVTDPVIGALSDRFAYRGLRRKPWIAVGAGIAALGLFNILNPPAAVGTGYLLGWSLVLYAGWTMVSVPYNAWGAELSADYDERTRITAWREGAALLGIFGAGALTAALAGAGWTERESTGAIAWAAIAFGAVFMPVLLFVVREGRTGGDVRAPAGRRSFREGMGALLANRPFLRLLSAWFLNGLANGIPAALFFIYLEYGLGADARLRPFFVLAYFAAAVASIPLWRALSGRIGKHRTWCWAMVTTCAAFVIVPALPQGAFVVFAAVCVITGMGLGADLVLPPAIQADVVDYQRYRSGQGRAGLLFALWGMSTKLALAAAVGLALPGVEALGFDPSAPTDGGRRMLAVIYALAPVVIKAVTIAVIWRFPLTAKKHGVIRRRLDQRHMRAETIGEAALG
jgi:Na+/melibiose symporter-like transporter